MIFPLSPSGRGLKRGKLDNFIKKGSGEEEKKLYVTGAPFVLRINFRKTQTKFMSLS